MPKLYKAYLKNNSRILRKNMTKAEVILWNYLRKKQLLGIQFYRQKPLGDFIVDFYCPSKKLVIEIDGGQHYIDGEKVLSDKYRDECLKNNFNLNVLRFTNDDIYYNRECVIDKILEALKSPLIPL